MRLKFVRSSVVAATVAVFVAAGLTGQAVADEAEPAPVDESTQIASRGSEAYPVESEVGAAAAGNCGVRVDLPHVSHTTAHQIHTRAESYCTFATVQSNSLNGVSYRSRWYGWEKRGSSATGPKAKQSVRVTVAINCATGTQHRWRTEGRGAAVISGRNYTAAAYEQNDNEITCR